MGSQRVRHDLVTWHSTVSPWGPADLISLLLVHEPASAHQAEEASTMCSSGEPRTQPSWRLHVKQSLQSLAQGLAHCGYTVIAVE